MSDTDRPAHHKIKLMLEYEYGVDPRTAVVYAEPIRNGDYVPVGWTDQDECQDCGSDDVPLRAIKMVNTDRMMLCRECFVTAVEVGEVDPTDPRLDGGRNV